MAMKWISKIFKGDSSLDFSRRNGYRLRNNDDLARNYYPRGHRVCVGCHREIVYGNYLGCMGAFFHPDCFCFRACVYPVTKDEFSLSEKKPNHILCFKELRHPKCDVSHQIVPINEAGFYDYIIHDFWDQKCCSLHMRDATAQCCSCGHLEMVGACAWSAQNLLSWMLGTANLFITRSDFFEGMNMRIDQQIPMILVERQVLNEAIQGENHVSHHMPEMSGLCLSDEEILRGPRNAGQALVGMRTQPHVLTRRFEVPAILVLYGLPRLLTGAILTHELMHAWFVLKGYLNLSPDVEEGMCQVMSHMWLEAEVLPASTSTSTSSSSSSLSRKGANSRGEMKLGQFFMYQIVEDTSAVYGGGFRAANAAVNKYGLRRTLDHIRLTGNLPL